ncbi:TPA: hypothetical protein ACXHWU_000740 [Morganella morganii]
MEFNLSGVWSIIKSPSIGFVLFIILLVLIFKIKDITVFYTSFRFSDFNRLKFIKNELNQISDKNPVEIKLLESMMKIELFHSGLGVSNPKIIPFFSYLSENVDFYTLYCLKKGIRYIDCDNFSLNKNAIAKYKIGGALFLFAAILFFISQCISADVEKMEMQWFYIILVIIFIAAMILHINNVPSKTEIKKISEILSKVDEEKYLKYKENFFNEYLKRGTPDSEKEVPKNTELDQ